MRSLEKRHSRARQAFNAELVKGLAIPRVDRVYQVQVARRFVCLKPFRQTANASNARLWRHTSAPLLASPTLPQNRPAAHVCICHIRLLPQGAIG